MDDTLLQDCEKAVRLARQVVPMTPRTEEVWESLHKRLCAAVGLPAPWSDKEPDDEAA